MFAPLYTKGAGSVKGFLGNIPQRGAKDIGHPKSGTSHMACARKTSRKSSWTIEIGINKEKTMQKFKNSLTFCRCYGKIKPTMGELYPFPKR
jgi:hypothetical protein